MWRSLAYRPRGARRLSRDVLEHTHRVDRREAGRCRCVVGRVCAGNLSEGGVPVPANTIVLYWVGFGVRISPRLRFT